MEQGLLEDLHRFHTNGSEMDKEKVREPPTCRPSLIFRRSWDLSELCWRMGWKKSRRGQVYRVPLESNVLVEVSWVWKGAFWMEKAMSRGCGYSDKRIRILLYQPPMIRCSAKWPTIGNKARYFVKSGDERSGTNWLTTRYIYGFNLERDQSMTFWCYLLATHKSVGPQVEMVLKVVSHRQTPMIHSSSEGKRGSEQVVSDIQFCCVPLKVSLVLI